MYLHTRVDVCVCLLVYTYMLALLLLTGCLGKWSLTQRLPQLKMITTHYLLVLCACVCVYTCSTPFSFTHSCHPLCALQGSRPTDDGHLQLLVHSSQHRTMCDCKHIAIAILPVSIRHYTCIRLHYSMMYKCSVLACMFSGPSHAILCTYHSCIIKPF